MRTHGILHWIAGDHGPESADAWELYTAFRGAELLPQSFHSDVAIDDAQTWALFCFCLWTLDDKRRPNNIANELLRDGVTAWTDPNDDDSNAVQFLHGVFTDWERCMQVDHILVNRPYQVMRVTMKDGTQVHFRNKSAAVPWSSGQDLSINDDHTTVRGMEMLWHVAGYFCGHVRPIYEDESAERGTVTPPTVVGHKFKK